MNHGFFFKLTTCFLFTFFSITCLSAEENFILIDGRSEEILGEVGPSLDEQYSPCSSFKIVLSLMGFDTGALKDENTPIWEFEEGYDHWLESWKAPQSPLTWMRCSCVWYSKLLSFKIGLETIKNYLVSFEYGNQDGSDGLVAPGPLNPFWINSSLRISPREQATFIQKMMLGKLPVHPKAIHMTKILLFKEEWLNGWKLYGKTGWSGSDITKDGHLEFSWFVGWVEKDDQFLPFAYLIRSKKINLEQRIPRVKQLIMESMNYSGLNFG